VVVGNFERIIVAFTPERLVTEGVIFGVALACTLVALLCSDSRNERHSQPDVITQSRVRLGATVALGLAAALLSIVADWAIVRMIYGDRFAGYANLHIRFGPRATVNQTQERSGGAFSR
jgi:hypothetical protein